MERAAPHPSSLGPDKHHLCLLAPLSPLHHHTPWQGVRFETVAIDASPAFVKMYDDAVAVWQDTRAYMHNNGLDNGKHMAQFYTAQLRFFRQLCTAAKVGRVGGWVGWLDVQLAWGKKWTACYSLLQPALQRPQ